MRKISTSRFFLWFIGVGLILGYLACSDQSHDPILASVDGKEIKLGEFIPKYEAFLLQAHLEDNLMSRYQYLNGYIDEHIILAEMDRTGMSNDPVLVKKLEKLHAQLMLEQYAELVVFREITNSENELKQLFTQEKTTLHVRHLFATDRETIQSYHRDLADGVSWEEIAEVCFDDPMLAENGGDLGWFKIGELEVVFERVAFALADGEISSPVKTKHGYSIIQVVERIIEPLIAEHDFQLHQADLDHRLQAYKKQAALVSHADELQETMDIHVNEEVFLQYHTAFGREASPDESLSRQELMKFGNGNVLTVEGARSLLDELSVEQYSRISSLQDLKDALTGKLVQQVMLSAAIDLGLNEDPMVLAELEERSRSVKLKHYLEELYMDVSDEDFADREKILNIYHMSRYKLARESVIMIDSGAVRNFILPEPSF
jgi:hypothetical protein